MTTSSANQRAVARGNIAVIAVSGFALLVHAAAGVLDERKLVLSPHGHLAILVVLAWLAAFFVSAVTLVRDWHRPLLALVCLVTSSAGFVAIFFGER